MSRGFAKKIPTKLLLLFLPFRDSYRFRGADIYQLRGDPLARGMTQPKVSIKKSQSPCVFPGI